MYKLKKGPPFGRGLNHLIQYIVYKQIARQKDRRYQTHFLPPYFAKLRGR